MCITLAALDPLTTKQNKEMDKLSLEFSALVADVAEILDKSLKNNIEKLKLVCYNLTTPEKSLLINAKKGEVIRACVSVFDMFYELRDHWRWDNHRLLFIIIKRSGSPEAMQKLKQFRSKIDYTKKLSGVHSFFQSMNKSPPPGYTKMEAIVEKDYAEITLQECEELDKYLSDCFGSAGLPPSMCDPSHSVKITWFIPTEAVSGLLSKAHQAREIFQFLSISFFQIDGIIIWNKKWPYSLQVKYARTTI